MKKSSAYGAALLSVLLGGGALAAGGYALASATPHEQALDCKITSPGNCSITISSYPDSAAGEHGKSGGAHPDWVSYSNDNLVVPANTTVHMTIDQYDSGGALNNSFFSHVWINGAHGTATYQIPQTTGSVTKYGAPQTLSGWNTNNIGHTFTLRGIPGSGTNLFVSIPLPADPATNSVTVGDTTYSSPVIVQFSFKTGSKGVYDWNCEFPCGGSREGQFGYAMSSFGYMSGAMTVQ
jgi:hypothetical protein